MRKLDVLEFGFSAVMAGVTCYLVYLSYSPVPFWDMWRGTLQFYLDASASNVAGWWAQHNEHRIVLARLLFFADNYLFRGAGILLFILNVVLAAACASILWCFAQAMPSARARDESRVAQCASLALILGILMSWTQSENFEWGFQSQFFLAQLLPAAALFWFARFAVERKTHQFASSLALGVLALGSMANGVLALPMVTAASVLLKAQNWARLTLLVSSILGIGAYLWGYQSVGHHASPMDSVVHHVGSIISYSLVFLGNPAGQFLGNRLNMATAAGVIVAAAGLCFGLREMMRRERNAFVVCLLLFVAYIALTAAITASGRINFGVGQAMSSRYATPALMAWIAIGIVGQSYIQTGMATTIRPAMKAIFTTVTVLVCAALAIFQFRAVSESRFETRTYESSVAALAAVLSVPDVPILKRVWVLPAEVLALTERARKAGTSFPVLSPYKDMREDLGKQMDMLTLAQGKSTCLGHIDKEGLVPDARGAPYRRLEGWVFAPEQGRVPRQVTFLDGAGKIVGYAMTGGVRPDIAQEIASGALRSGLTGYARLTPGTRLLAGVTEDCVLPLNL